MARKHRPARRPKPDTTAADTVAARPAERRGVGRRLSLADRYAIIEAHRANPQWSYVELARHCGVNPETARLTCLAAGRSAAELMSAFSGPMLRKWITAAAAAAVRGDHRPAKDWLLHAGSIDPLPETARGSGPAVVIINNPMPGMPGFDSTASTVLQVGPTDGDRREIAARPESLSHSKT